MEKYIYDKNNGLWYERCCEYYIPMLKLPEEEPAEYGKYGMLRKSYLKEYRPARYQSLLLSGKLMAHLNQVDREARERMELLVDQMVKEQGVTEKLKAQDAMLWVGRMNNIRNVAEEIVLKEIVYA